MPDDKLVYVLMQQYLGDASVTAPGWPEWTHPLTLDLMGCLVFPRMEAAKKCAENEWAEYLEPDGLELEWEPLPHQGEARGNTIDACARCRDWLTVIYGRPVLDRPREAD
jgi:hypothetical protein